MSEDKKENGYAEAKEALDLAKDTLATAKTDLRAFRTTHKIRKASQIKDDKTKKEYLSLEAAVKAATEAKTAAQAAVKELKPVGQKGGGKRYSYGNVIDLETNESREASKAEEKRWRTHARREAKKDDNEYTDPAQVPFDADFFKPKPKKEKKAKEEKPEAKADAKADTAEKKPRRKKK